MAAAKAVAQENTSQKESSASSTTEVGDNNVQLTEQIKNEFNQYLDDYEWDHLRRLLKLNPMSYQQVYQEFQKSDY